MKKRKTKFALNIGLIMFYTIMIIVMVVMRVSAEPKAPTPLETMVSFVSLIVTVMSSITFFVLELAQEEPPVKAAATLIAGIIAFILNIK